jgi:hypothetical protein
MLSRRVARDRSTRAACQSAQQMFNHLFLPVGNCEDNSTRFLLRMDNLCISILPLVGNMLAYKAENYAGVESRSTARRRVSGVREQESGVRIDDDNLRLPKVERWELSQKDVKNEDRSQWFIENKRAKKVLPMS